MISKYELFSNSVACLYRDIQKLERIEMAKYGLKGPHAQCLLSLSRYPEGLIATQLCDLCEKDKAAISRTVAELEEADLVQRLEHNGTPLPGSSGSDGTGQRSGSGCQRTGQAGCGAGRQRSDRCGPGGFLPGADPDFRKSS